MPSVTTGYIEAVVIPAGARRIRVVEDKPAHSFLGKLLPYELILMTGVVVPILNLSPSFIYTCLPCIPSPKFNPGVSPALSLEYHKSPKWTRQHFSQYDPRYVVGREYSQNHHFRTG